MITAIILYIIIAILGAAFYIVIRKLDKTIENLSDENIKLRSDKRSLETTYGYAIENMAPYLKDLGDDYDPKKLRQLGQPIDYLYFGPDFIEIIEVKTGNSKLNHNQKKIKAQVESGKIKFRELRIKR